MPTVREETRKTPPAPAPPTEVAVPGALPDIPDPVPDSTTDGARLGRIIVRAAATRGERSRLDATVRRHEVWTSVLRKFDPPVLLSCVASGSATGDYSHLGSVQACRSLHGRLGDRATVVAIDAAWKDADGGSPGSAAELERLLRSVTSWVENSLSQTARGKTLEPESLATGLTFLLSRLGDGRRRQHLVAGVGDGILLQLSGDGKWSTKHEGNGAARNMLPTGVDQVTWRPLATGPGDVLVLCSATTAPVLQRDTRGGGGTDWRSGPPDLVRFLWQLNQPDSVEHDDRAAIAIWESFPPASAT